MSNQTTRRGFLQKIAMGSAAAAAAASGLIPLASRADLLMRLADHLNNIGYQVLRYAKF